MADNYAKLALQMIGMDRMADKKTYRLEPAAAFWISFLVVPMYLIGAFYGSWTVLLPILSTWYLFNVLDYFIGQFKGSGDPSKPESDLTWYRRVTTLWPFVQFILLFSAIWYIPRAEHLGPTETIFLFVGLGVITGTVGINFSHELMHQKNRFERRLSEWLLAMVLYSHFRSEHLFVHHVHVATPRDTVTARYNENFHRFFRRVVIEGIFSAWKAETALLARKKLPATHWSNPFFRYAVQQSAMLAFAFFLSGWVGMAWFVFQAFFAFWQLELVNYVEHYGLTRKYLGDGKYEHVKPRHSWNADQRASNWLLLNLQRHSNHHFNPSLRFPLLQTYDNEEAPLLPYGYATMTLLALYPRGWRKFMNPRVREWRQMHYPEIEDWTHYNKATNPTTT